MTLPSLSKYTLSPTVSRMTQPEPLGFHGSCVRFEVVTFDRAIVHKIHLDVAHAPLIHQSGIGLSQILLGRRVRSVQYKQLILAVHGSGMDWLVFCIFDKPIRVMLINPGALR